MEIKFSCPLYGDRCNVKKNNKYRDCSGQYIGNTKSGVFYFRAKSGELSDVYHCDITNKANQRARISLNKLTEGFWE